MTIRFFCGPNKLKQQKPYGVLWKHMYSLIEEESKLFAFSQSLSHKGRRVNNYFT